MKNIFIFIRRYFNFLFFLVLQIVSLILLIRYNQTHEAVYAGVANEITGRINLQYNKIQNYFHLKENNKLLLEENTRLKNMLRTDFESPDSSRLAVLDTLVRDTLGRQRKFIWLPAKVVNNTVSQQLNYLTLHRGANQGVKKDMAVIGPQGVVGTVIDVSENFSRVMSLLHRNSKVSSMLKKGNIQGTVEWDGKDPRFITLRNIPKSTPVAKGDTVVTSSYSANFPSDILVGFVDEISKDPGSNFLVIRLKTATNFYNLEYVNLVENVQWDEQRRLEAAPVKNQ
ncbi:rod shape-determining protein MreC [Segetibacter koreensis]|uniref:rod shape-determining protein MreC n=1 Tax=Segetibacter koreensis TaxID=398037 RepID=UPI000377BA49|nr:rod shape-determining protein MreC [Segetibacter koreensis]